MRSVSPRWLHAPVTRGRRRQFAVRARGLRAEVGVRIWSPADADVREELPLLVAHDGPDYDRKARLTRYCAAAIRAGELPRHRVALLGAVRRDEWYSASAVYARALCGDVLSAV